MNKTQDQTSCWVDVTQLDIMQGYNYQLYVEYKPVTRNTAGASVWADGTEDRQTPSDQSRSSFRHVTVV